jgi:hypothetical protein
MCRLEETHDALLYGSERCAVLCLPRYILVSSSGTHCPSANLYRVKYRIVRLSFFDGALRAR